MPASSFTVLRGADFFPVADVPLSVFRAANGTLSRHSHDFQELVLVARGTAQHTLFPPDSDTPRSASVTEGDLLLIPIGWSHLYEQCATFEIFNVLFAPQLLAHWAQGNATFRSFDALLDGPAQWTLQRGEREHLETLLQTIMREFTGRQRGFGIAAQAKLSEILVWLDRLNTQPPGRGSPDSEDAVLRAVAFMEHHFAEPIVLADIARSAHLSAHYFSEVFKNATGLSPGRYLLRLRLEHARYLLLTTTRPITEVAREAGFADASYFARAFKTSFGSPQPTCALTEYNPDFPVDNHRKGKA